MSKKASLIFCLAFYCFVTSVFANSTVDALLQKPQISFVPPEVRVQSFASGLTVYYVQDEDLPVFEMSAFFKVGRVHDPEEQSGLAEIFTMLWSTGGTTRLGPAEFLAALENDGAKLDGEVYQEFIEIKLTTLKKNQHETFALFFELMQNPGFDAQKLQSIKERSLAGLKRKNDKASDVASREFLKILYGEHHPVAFAMNEESLSRIDDAAIRNFYDRHIAPNAMTLVATGPVAADDFLRDIESVVSGWQKPNVAILPFPDVALPKQLGSHQWIQFPGAQSVIMMGHRLVSRDHPDKLKLMLFNAMLGGEVLGSRLGNRIRSELGLAYTASSQVQFFAIEGYFVMTATPTAERTMQTIDEMTSVLQNMLDNPQGFFGQEFLDTKNRILNQFIFQYEKRFEVAKSKYLFDAYGYPADYLQQYYEAISAMTADDVAEVVSQYFKTNALHTLIVGDLSRVPEVKRIKTFEKRSLK